MGLLSPLYLAGAAAAVVPIVLHLLKRQQEQRVRFAAVAFLKDAPVERTSRRRLREWLLLMLRVAALVLLALAFARPFFRPAAAAAAGTTVVALDTSFSMSAPGRFERAKELARDAIRNAARADDVAVVTFADQADVLVRPTADRGSALAAVDAARSGFGSTKYRAGVNAASALAAGRRAAIVIVTDLQENGWDAGEPASVSGETRVEVRDVGALPDNLAITALRVVDGRAVATVLNNSRQGRQVRGRLSLDGRPAAQATVSIGARESADMTFHDVLAAQGVVAVAIDDPQGLQADNVRYALVSGATRPGVLVVTATGDSSRDAFYLEHALAAGRAGDASQVTSVSASSLSASPPEQIRRHAVVVLLSTRGLEPRGREWLASYVAGGGGLLIAAGPDVDGEVIADVLGSDRRLGVTPALGRPGDEQAHAALTLAPADVRHPIFRAFGAEAASLGLVTFRTIARISGATCETLAKFTSGDAAILDCAAGDGRALIVGSDLNNRWNDFPLRASFVPFVHEAVRYLSAPGPRAAEYLVGDVPAGVAPVPGVVDEGGRRAVVNVDSRESEPARISADEFQAAVTRLKDASADGARISVSEQEGRQHLWQFLLVSMLVTLAVEGLIAARAA